MQRLNWNPSWGESAGAISVSLHMLANGGNTEGLFRAGVMESGAPIPVGDIENGQIYYDSIVADTGCSGAADTLQCLREVPYDKLKAAIDNTPSIFAYQVCLKTLTRTSADDCVPSPYVWHGSRGPTEYS